MKKINNKSINLGLKILTILAFALIFVPFKTSAASTISYYAPYSNPVPVNNVVDTSNPKPAISSISPKSSNVGVGTKTITITGSGFTPGSVARINGLNRSTTFIDDSHLLVQINGNDTSAYRTNGGFFITVWNGAPGGGFSNANFFTVNSNVVGTVSSTANINNNTNNNVNSSPDTFTDTTQSDNGTVNGTNDSYSNLASNAIFGSNSFLPSGIVQWILFAIVILLIIIVVRRIFGAKKNYDDSPLKHA